MMGFYEVLRNGDFFFEHKCPPSKKNLKITGKEKRNLLPETRMNIYNN